MPFDRRDFPNSMKNLDKEVRDKAIDIANAMIEEGYEEKNAIPIAISQAKEWANKASSAELKEIRKKNLKDHQKDKDKTKAKLQNSNVEVSYDHEKEKWQVKSKKASTKKATTIAKARLRKEHKK